MRMAVGFVVMPIMVSHLGSEAYGIWTLAVAFTIFGYLNLAELGIGSSVIKYVAEFLALNKIKETNEIISTSIILYAILGSIASSALFLFTKTAFFNLFKVPPELIGDVRFLMYLIAIKALIDFPAQPISSILEGMQRYDVWRTIEITREILRAAAMVIALFMGKGIVALGAILILESTFQLISSIIAVRLIFPQWRFTFNINRSIITKISLFSGKMLGIRINATIYNGMDKLIISTLLNVSLLTPYAIASSIHSIANRVMSLVSLPLLPTASMLDARKDYGRLHQILILGTKYTLVCSFPITLGLIILSKWLIIFWMGNEFAYVTPLAQLFLSYLLINAFAVVAYNMLIGIDRAGSLLLIQIVSTIINLILSVILCSFLGVSAVIWGTVIGTSFAVIPYLIILLKEIKLNWIEFLKKTLFAVLPFAVFSTIILLSLTTLRPPKSLIEVGYYMAINILSFFMPFCLLGLDKFEKELFIERFTAYTLNILNKKLKVKK